MKSKRLLAHMTIELGLSMVAVWWIPGAFADSSSSVSMSDWLSSRRQDNWATVCNDLRTSTLLKRANPALYDVKYSEIDPSPMAKSMAAAWWLTITPGFQIPIPNGSYHTDGNHHSDMEGEFRVVRRDPSLIFISVAQLNNFKDTEDDSEQERLKTLFGHEMSVLELWKLPYLYKLRDLNCDAKSNQQIDEAEKAGIALLLKQIADGNSDATSLRVYRDLRGKSNLVKAGHLSGRNDRMFIDVFVGTPSKPVVVSYKLEDQDDFATILQGILSANKDTKPSKGSPPWIAQVERRIRSQTK
jgi:hypothetical protein